MRIAKLCLSALTLTGMIAPAQATRDPEAVGRVSYIGPITKPRPDPKSQWVQLGTPTPARHGTEYFMVGKESGQFLRLRLELTDGWVIVTRIRVHFVDGMVQTSSARRRLNTHHRSEYVELDSVKAIDSIDVSTESWTSGSYQLSGFQGSIIIAAGS
jgi:hypothetical protein